MLAIIPARSGSKGLPGKNTAPLNGRPLIEWTLRAALESGLFDVIAVSSDCPKVERITRDFNVEFLARNELLATDYTPMSEVVLDVFNHDFAAACDSFAPLQPTSPLRTQRHIQECYKIFKDTGGESCVSVSPVDRTLLKSFFAFNGELVPIESGKYADMRRQDLPQVFKPNGAIYMQSKFLFFDKKSFIPRKSSLYEMTDEESVDIDSAEDLRRAEVFFEKNGSCALTRPRDGSHAST